VFHTVTIRAADRAASEAFYGTLLPTIGISQARVFSIVGGAPPTTNLHIGFGAPSRAEVDEFWRAGMDAGYPDDGPPGPRPQYGPDYYGGFLRDPDGNSAEGMHNDWERGRAEIDHLWIRVSDLARAKAFYDTIGGHAGFHAGWTSADPLRIGYEGGLPGTFSIVQDGSPTTNARIAFAGKVPRASMPDPDGNEIEVVA
jgi:catechol 2,3-dioxygenase-like lactoylglutathione lyase family enzyme